jgi:hypothetical protein
MRHLRRSTGGGKSAMIGRNPPAGAADGWSGPARRQGNGRLMLDSVFTFSPTPCDGRRRRSARRRAAAQ